MISSATIELFCRAANYLAVGMLYLRSNPFLRTKLQKEHFKHEILGHWGVCPGIIAVYAHTSDLVRRKNRRAHLVVGSGHAGTALLPCSYLDGSLGHYYSELSYGERGVVNLFNSYATTCTFPTEISPRYPGTLYVGGELGYALAFSQGFSLGNKEIFSVCVIGDGEMETSVSQASWQGFSFLSSQTDGKVLPVINANGNKMGSSSLLANRSHKAIEEYFNSFNIAPLFASTNHTKIASAFETAYEYLFNSETKIQPVIILETPKGWTSPKEMSGRKFEGSFNSHKPVLKHPAESEDELEKIHEWLLSYDPETLFDEDGVPNSNIFQCLPSEHMRLGYCHNIGNIKSNSFRYERNDTSTSLSTFLRGVLTDDSVFVFSPDELHSNRLTSLIDSYQLKLGDESNEIYNCDSRIYEILNEHLCFAWAQGCSRAGKVPILISYEAFAPVFISMAEQYIKVVTVNADVEWQPNCPSINILLTSLGWYNTPTHHNPSFVDSLIGRSQSIVRIYMPICFESINNYLVEVLNSTNRLNVIVYHKYTLPLIEKNLSRIKRHNSWVEFTLEDNYIKDVAIVAIGDCMLEQVFEANEILISSQSNCVVDILAVEDMSILELSNHPERQKFLQKISDVPVVWVYNGFPKTIKSLLWDLKLLSPQVVLGYIGYDQTPSGKDRFAINQTDSKAIVNEVLKLKIQRFRNESD